MKIILLLVLKFLYETESLDPRSIVRNDSIESELLLLQFNSLEKRISDSLPNNENPKGLDSEILPAFKYIKKCYEEKSTSRTLLLGFLIKHWETLAQFIEAKYIIAYLIDSANYNEEQLKFIAPLVTFMRTCPHEILVAEADRN